MAIYDLIPVPSFVVITPSANTAIGPSPLIASAQTLDRGGMKWKMVYTYIELRAANRASVMALMLRLRGQAHRIRVPVYDNPKIGAYGGTPLVDLGSQTGSSINIKGLTNNITNWINEGDYFSINVNGEHELKMAVANASSNGTGRITIDFEPRLRASPSNNAVVFVEDGTLTKPNGIFVLENSENNWSSRPGNNSKRGAFNLAMIEDVFATQ